LAARIEKLSGKKDFGAIWRNLAAKMKKLSAKEDFAWERRSQAPGFFLPKLTQMLTDQIRVGEGKKTVGTVSKGTKKFHKYTD